MSDSMTLRGDVTPWYKQRWPWLLIAGPATVIVAGIVTVWLAIVSNDGLVADDYYKQGLAVNQQLQRDQEAAHLGIQADLMRAGDKLRLLVRSAEATSLPQTLSVKFAHPTRAGQDQLVQLSADGGGIYSGKLVTEVAGRWLVTIEEPSGSWRLLG